MLVYPSDPFSAVRVPTISARTISAILLYLLLSYQKKHKLSRTRKFGYLERNVRFDTMLLCVTFWGWVTL